MINKNVKNESTENVSNADSQTEKKPKIDFVETEHDFGIIKQGERVSHTFIFTNNGNSDLILNNVSASCGCTVPEYDKNPIAPGKDGKIEEIGRASCRERV